jgi:uncharacterized membrane protein
MHKGRLEAFSDGVIAILITIMVLGLETPKGAELSSLKPLMPTLVCYALSFIYLGIYWNNHHHMLQTVQHVTGGMLWANLHLLFWLSLIPFTTNWLGTTSFASTPAACYGGVLLMAAIAYTILQAAILRAPGGDPVLAAAIGNDWKGKFSLLCYVLAIGLSFVNRWIACGLYVVVAIIWLTPDKRIERAIAAQKKAPNSPQSMLNPPH